MAGYALGARANMLKLMDEIAVPEARMWGPAESLGWGGRFCFTLRTDDHKCIVHISGLKRPWVAEGNSTIPTIFVEGTPYDWDGAVKAARAILTSPIPASRLSR